MLSSAVLSLAVLSVCVLNSATSQYQRDRDLGALPLVSVTATSATAEVWGRWAGVMVGVLEGWMMGLALVALATMLHPTCFARWLWDWLFCGLWLSALGALGLVLSAAARTVNAAFLGVVVTLVGAVVVPYAFLAWLGFVVEDRWLSNRILEHIATLAGFIPPSPLLLATLWLTPYRLVSWLSDIDLFLPALLWLAFTPLALRFAAFLVRKNLPLRHGATPPAGPKGLMPAGAAAAERPAASPPSLIDTLLPFATDNPFYRAYRSGFIRVYAGVVATPGSAVPAGILLVTLVVFSMLGLTGNAEPCATGLLSALALATAVSFSEGLSIGARALSAERDQDTWPMLVVTGISPARVLQGKFAMAFYALSGEWTLPMVLWPVAVLASGHLGLVALALIHPAGIALGILLGLWLASQPRYLVLNLKFLGLYGVYLIAKFAVLALLAKQLHDHGAALFAATVHALDPFSATWTLAATGDPRLWIPALLCFLLQAALVAGCAAFVWRSAQGRLARVMRGE